MTPWFGYNLTRFDRPVPVSLGLGYTMMVSDCGPTYHGDRLGFFDARRGFREKALRLPTAPDADAEMREIGSALRPPPRRAPPVVVAELGRVGLSGRSSCPLPPVRTPAPQSRRAERVRCDTDPGARSSLRRA